MNSSSVPRAAAQRPQASQAARSAARAGVPRLGHARRAALLCALGSAVPGALAAAGPADAGGGAASAGRSSPSASPAGPSLAKGPAPPSEHHPAGPSLPLRGSWLVGEHLARASARRSSARSGASLLAGSAASAGSGARLGPSSINQLSLLLCGSIAMIVAVMAASVAFISVQQRKKGGRSEETSGESGYGGQGSGESSRIDPSPALCPTLVVPDGRRLACVFKAVVTGKRQDEQFDVSSVPSSGGVPLFRIRISENEDSPGIYIETLGEVQTLAFLSTQPLWDGARGAVSLPVHRPWGALFGTVRRGDGGDYTVFRGGTRALTLTGDVQRRSLKVLDAYGSIVGHTQEVTGSPGSYQVNLSARVDVGLVLLGILGMEKCEEVCAN